MDKIEELLTRGVENIIPGKNELEKILRSGAKLNVYNGIDPTATKIHVGHGVPLRKLQQFVDLGHNVNFLIGDFTARVGDTSDKEGERPSLSPEQIETNFQTYKKQAEKFLDFSKVKIVHNSEWLSKLSFADILDLTRHFSLNDFISRELIKKRLETGSHIRLDEVIYPLMQGYDSYFLDTDVQVGGTDQTFNMQAGRTLQKDLRSKESFVMANGFLEGTDGRKMSKSWGNAIWITDEPSEMFGKVMSLKDDLIIQYFTLATNLPIEQVDQVGERLKSENPMILKKELAMQIVTELHDEKNAIEAKNVWENTYSKNIFPEETAIKLDFQKISSTPTIADAIGTAQNISASEVKRFITAGSVDLNNTQITDRSTIVKVGDEVKVGDKVFIKIVKNK